MSNRTIEAILRISAKTGDMRALQNLQRQLGKVDAQAKAFNRTNNVAARNARAAWATASRAVAPIAAGYAAKQSYEEFANLERSLTRTGLKLGATRQDMEALKSTAASVAQRYAVTNDAIYKTIDSYAETGAELKDIKSDIDTIVKAQQAMGAEGRDVVASWDAARKNFGVMSSDAERFYDILAKGSATGKFEGSDLAKYLPSLLPTASVHGLQGLSGTAQIVGALEAMRDRTGTSETAATSMTDFLDKLNSPDVQKNFKKLNIDLPKAMEEARDSGEDFFTGMSKILNRATHGDVAKLGQIFGERDSRNFARMLMQDLSGVEERIRVVREQSKGTISVNVKAITEDAQASIDQLSNSVSNLTNSAGSLLDTLGASSRFKAIATDFDRLNAAIKGGWTPLDSIKAWFTNETAAGAVDAAAWKGGLRTPEQIAMIEAYKAYADSRGQSAAAAARMPSYGVAIGKDGVPYPVPYQGGERPTNGERQPTYGSGIGPDRVPYPVPYKRPLSDDEAMNSIPFYTDAGLRDVPPDLMTRRDRGARIGQILDADSGASKDPNYEEFQKAAQQLEEGGNALTNLSNSAKSAFEQAASKSQEAAGTQQSAAGQLIEAARALNAAAGSLQRLKSTVNADVGRSGADVDAGGIN